MSKIDFFNDRDVDLEKTDNSDQGVVCRKIPIETQLEIIDASCPSRCPKRCLVQ